MDSLFLLSLLCLFALFALIGFPLPSTSTIPSCVLMHVSLYGEKINTSAMRGVLADLQPLPLVFFELCYRLPRSTSSGVTRSLSALCVLERSTI
eukprot:m.8358 g.8358  ORF g.8358 m.8358 type:complete len:94 (+) comp2851_c0_seq1:2148-2429(+)